MIIEITHPFLLLIAHSPGIAFEFKNNDVGIRHEAIKVQDAGTVFLAVNMNIPNAMLAEPLGAFRLELGFKFFCFFFKGRFALRSDVGVADSEEFKFLRGEVGQSNSLPIFCPCQSSGPYLNSPPALHWSQMPLVRQSPGPCTMSLHRPQVIHFFSSLTLRKWVGCFRNLGITPWDGLEPFIRA